MKTCEYCGKEIENPITARKTDRRFCSISCRNKSRIDPQHKSIFTCDWCGCKFETWAYRKSRFCSAQCRSEFAARQPRRNGVKRQYQPKKKVTWKCKQCGIEMTTFKCRIRDTCSKRCARLYSIEYTEIKCGNCGKPIRVSINNTAFLRKQFCSKKCASCKQSEKMIGDNNPNWRGGTPQPYDRGRNWQSQSRKARERDMYTCQLCGQKGICVHHIIPYRNFNGDWKTANKLDNLITLCIRCHAQVEHGKIQCPNPI